MRLFAEQGYERTTIAEVADAADVSPRTIAAYFPTKLDMATAYADAVAARAAATLTQHVEDGMLAGFDHWLRAEETEFYDPELAALASAMYAANPELDAIGSAHVSSAMEAGKLALAAEFGTNVDPLKLRLGAAAMKATLAFYMSEINANGVSTEGHQALLEVIAALLDAIGSRAARTK